MRRITGLSAFVLCSLALVFVPAAWGATDYVYTGNYLSSHSDQVCGAPCANYTTSMRVSGWFRTGTALAPNLTNSDISGQITAWSFDDGINTLAHNGALSTGAFIYEFKVTTDGSGNISGQSITLEVWESGTVGAHATNERISYIVITTHDSVYNNAHCNTTAGSDCTAVENDGSTSSGITATAGTWAIQDPTPPASSVSSGGGGGSVAPLSLSLFAILGYRRRKHL